MKNRYQAIALLTAILLAGYAFAGERGPRHARGQLGMGAVVIEHLARALHRLDLSEAQRSTIQGDLKGMKESMKPLVQEMLETRKALHQQITAESYDADAVVELATQQAGISAEMTIMASETAAGILAQLTEEQRAELHAMAEFRRAHRQAHREQKKPRRGPRHATDG